jgi:hypothetical protein
MPDYYNKEENEMACRALECSEVVCLAHYSTIIESKDSEPFNEEELLEALVFEIVSKHMFNDDGPIEGIDYFSKIHTAYGTIAYVFDSYPWLYISKENYNNLINGINKNYRKA